MGRICLILHDLTSICIRYQGLESIDNGHWSTELSDHGWLVVSNCSECRNLSLVRFELRGNVSPGLKTFILFYNDNAFSQSKNFKVIFLYR